jgi:hypothetical protein
VKKKKSSYIALCVKCKIGYDGVVEKNKTKQLPLFMKTINTGADPGVGVGVHPLKFEKL